MPATDDNLRATHAVPSSASNSAQTHAANVTESSAAATAAATSMSRSGSNSSDAPPSGTASMMAIRRHQLQHQHQYRHVDDEDDEDDDEAEAAAAAAGAAATSFAPLPRSSVEPERVLSRKPSDGSIRSNVSTSSMFSVSSRISRIPNAFRSSIVSVKDFMSKSSSGRASRPRSRSRLATMMMQQHKEEALPSSADLPQPAVPQTIHSTSGCSVGFPDHHHHRMRKRTPSALGLYTIFSSGDNSKDTCLPVAPPIHAGRPALGGDGGDDAPTMMQRAYSENHKLQLQGASHGSGGARQSKAVGELLFGVDIGNMAFFDTDPADSSVSSTISGMGDAASDDVRSEQCTTDATSASSEVVWGRQRAKSCQEGSKASSSSLRRLARGQYASSAALNSHKLSAPPIPPAYTAAADELLPMDTAKAAQGRGVSSVVSPGGAPATGVEAATTGGAHSTSKRKLTTPGDANTASGAGVAGLYHNILVTATLTTLHSKLISECDHLLASTLLSPAGTIKRLPEEQLRILANDVHKMTDMVEWDPSGDGSKAAIQALFVAVNDKIAQASASASNRTVQPTSRKDSKDAMVRIAEQNQAVATAVKEIITSLKQLVNQSVCQYHKVYERSMVIPCKNYRIEGKNRLGSSEQDYAVDGSTRPDYAQASVEHMDEEAYWFRNTFVDKDYTTFLGSTGDKDPVLVTAVCEESKADDVAGKRQYHVIIRRKQGQDIRKTIPDSFLLRAPSADVPEKESIPDAIWKAVIEPSLDIPFDQVKKLDIDAMNTSGLQKDILMLDEQAVHDRYKFGVLYIKEGQTREEEWLSNNHDSQRFDRFLNIIGRKVSLRGYDGWAGGLDTKGGYSGEHTFVNEWNGHSIAYHVSTMIPAHPGDKQQVQRKRHIGNDIVCVVFAEGKQPFNPAAIKSQFLHVFIIVHPEEWNGRTGWRVEVAMAENVPSFGPCLPTENAVFYDEAELRSFMLAKLVNAEYAAYQSPKFAQPMARAREGILAHIMERGCKLAHPTELSAASATATGSLSSAAAHHIQSSSTASDNSSSDAFVAPAASRSSMIKDFSEGIIAAGLGRRRSGQELNDARLKPAVRAVVKPRKSKAESDAEDGSSTSAQQRSCSEQDLMQSSSASANMSGSRSSGAIVQNSSKNERHGFRHKAQSILTSFGGTGRRQP